MIFHDSSLREMALYAPLTKDAMMQIKGVGLKKFDSYGDLFLAVINEYSS